MLFFTHFPEAVDTHLDNGRFGKGEKSRFGKNRGHQIREKAIRETKPEWHAGKTMKSGKICGSRFGKTRNILFRKIEFNKKQRKQLRGTKNIQEDRDCFWEKRKSSFQGGKVTGFRYVGKLPISVKNTGADSGKKEGFDSGKKTTDSGKGKGADSGKIEVTRFGKK